MEGHYEEQETDQYWVASTEHFYLFLEPALELLPDDNLSPVEIHTNSAPGPLASISNGSGNIPDLGQESDAKTPGPAPTFPESVPEDPSHSPLAVAEETNCQQNSQVSSPTGNSSITAGKSSPTNTRFTCPECHHNLRETRELNRHLWRDHPAYAETHGIPSEKKACPVDGCTYRGRKDNLLRHCKSRHPSFADLTQGQL
ncbi:hypothetical protein QBC43DRAFT_300935 [Cladorrhinum sp. PSN259]|nr:hypothetical protein QBC43DRAFT_300935 [Cladorrhinum sp. PSN259]